MDLFDRSMPDFEDKVITRLTGRFDPPAKLRDIISTRFMQDIVYTYRYPLIISEDGMASVPVTQSILQEKGISVRRLHDLAIENTKKQYQYHATEMENILSEYGVSFGEMPWIREDFPMIVLTNQYHLNGASCLMDSSFLDEVADTYFKGRDYLILPSSIHEVIAIPTSLGSNYRDLEQMVREVNEMAVAPEDQLSNSVYRYDRKAKIFELAATQAQRERVAKHRAREMER